MTPHRRRRIVVLRTSRFLALAIAHARASWPGADLRIVHQQGTEVELDALGIAPGHRITLPRGTRLTPATLLTSAWGWRLVGFRPDEVVLQWWNANGDGHAAADRAALLVQPRGFHVVLASGATIQVSAGQRVLRPLRTSARRACGAAIVVAVAVASAALWPMSAWLRRRERRRLAEQE